MITNLIRPLSLVLFTVVSSLSSWGAPPTEKDHEQLRALLRNATRALNEADFDAVAPFFAKNFTFTTADARVLHSTDEIKAYYTSLTQGPEALVKKVTVNPEADGLTRFVSDDIGYVTGTSQDTYLLADGDTSVIPSRWTATVIKEEGSWKALAVQSTVSLIDNPILVNVIRRSQNFVLFAAIASLLVGGAVGFLIGRRRSARQLS